MNRQRILRDFFLFFTYPRHPPINHEISPVDKTALVAREEEDGLGLLDRFAEAAGWEVDFAAVALGGIVAEPVLEEGGAGGKVGLC